MLHSRISHTQSANDKNRLPNIKGLPLAEDQPREARFGKFTTYLSMPLLMAFVLVSLLFLAGCSKKEADTPVPPSLQSVSITDLTKYLSNVLDIGEEKVIYNTDSKIFTISGDMLISREEAEKYFQSNRGARTTHRRGPIIVSDQYVRNIKVYIDPTMPPGWINAARSGLFNWNYINSRVRFVEVSNIIGANIAIGAAVLPYGTLGQAFLPAFSDGRPGNPITVNTLYNYLAPNQKEAIMIHELGHTLGFSHTDRAEPTQGDRFINGTPTVDPFSIMRASLDTSVPTPWNGFSPGDMIAIFTLYPR